jgi:hypothetical protein
MRPQNILMIPKRLIDISIQDSEIGLITTTRYRSTECFANYYFSFLSDSIQKSKLLL